MTMFAFEIPLRTPTLNDWLRMHWRKRGRASRDISMAVIFACRPPRVPLKYCRITIRRESTQEPDRDGLVGGVKPLLDALQPFSKRHPHGLGFIVDDSPRCVLDLVVIHVPGKGRRTHITIEAADAPEKTGG